MSVIYSILHCLQVGAKHFRPKRNLMLTEGIYCRLCERGKKIAWMRLKDHVSSWKVYLARCEQHGRRLAFPSNPSPKRKSKSGIFWAAHLLTSTGPHGSRLRCIAIKEAIKKTRKLHGSQPKSFQNSSQSMYLKTIFSYESKFIICSLLHNFYSRNNLYATPGHSYHKGQDWILLFVKFQNKVHFLPGCFWTAWNNTGSVAQ